MAGIGIISDEQLEKELQRNSVVKIGVTQPSVQGRKNGDINVPDSLRKVIAQDQIENGRQSAIELAESVGVSASSVSAYVNGSTSTKSYHNRDTELNKSNNDVRSKIAGKAKHRLLSALKEITPEKLQSAKLKDISGVARDMSAIIKNMEPKESGDVDKSTKVQVVLYSPQRKSEADFETITVKE